jgi:hypothetical protein
MSVSEIEIVRNLVVALAAASKLSHADIRFDVELALDVAPETATFFGAELAPPDADGRSWLFKEIALDQGGVLMLFASSKGET